VEHLNFYAIVDPAVLYFWWI